MSEALSVTLAAIVAAAATWTLARAAVRVGFVDSGADARERKLQARAVPAVGGIAIFIALALVSALDRDASVLGFRDVPWPALAMAFATGLADDLAPNGLRPLSKLAGQIAAGFLFALPVVQQHGLSTWPTAALLWVGAVAAQNALNTFDNADGAATAVTACGFALGAPIAAVAVAAFLPFNLWIGTSDSGRRPWTPTAYLGDAGSHLLGLALFASPVGWVALWLPILDLARLVLVRRARGVPPWVGDRRHLAHRLQAAGLSPTGVVAVLVAITLPALLGHSRDPLGTATWIGMGLSLTAFVWVVRSTPSPD